MENTIVRLCVQECTLFTLEQNGEMVRHLCLQMINKMIFFLVRDSVRKWTFPLKGRMTVRGGISFIAIRPGAPVNLYNIMLIAMMMVKIIILLITMMIIKIIIMLITIDEMKCN